MPQFTLRARQFFLTYPQCDVSKDVALASLLHLLSAPLVEWIVIAKEKHKDGNPHLHVALKMKDRTTISGQAYFDLGNHHGSYEVMRNILKSFQYLSKADPEPLCHGVDLKTQLEVYILENQLWEAGMIAAEAEFLRVYQNGRLLVRHTMFFQLRVLRTYYDLRTVFCNRAA